MFTIQQIKAAHAKVKSGADFPAYIQEMKELGVKLYEHFVSDGHIQYYGLHNFTLSTDARWAPRQVSTQSDAKKLKESLVIHQQGQTDYSTFCEQAAEAGVEKWIVDLEKMTCIYYDITGTELLIEKIPTPKQKVA